MNRALVGRNGNPRAIRGSAPRGGDGFSPKVIEGLRFPLLTRAQLQEPRRRMAVRMAPVAEGSYFGGSNDPSSRGGGTTVPLSIPTSSAPSCLHPSLCAMATALRGHVLRIWGS